MRHQVKHAVLKHKFVAALLMALVIGASLAGPAVSPAAAADPVYTGFLSSTAVGGYDPVAYFKQGKPVKGSSQYSMKYKGATWKFSSKENLEAFKANPEKYAPQYGGYCAWAIAMGKTAAGDPKYWKIVGGKLYLNYDADIQKRWEKDVPGFIQKADTKWPAVLKN